MTRHDRDDGGREFTRPSMTCASNQRDGAAERHAAADEDELVELVDPVLVVARPVGRRRRASLKISGRIAPPAYIIQASPMPEQRDGHRTAP
jgi:hypothetical protein